MTLQSQLFRGDPKLEAAAVSDPAHIVPGATGPHVGKIQLALIQLDGAEITQDGIYSPATAVAVLAYKQKRNIVSHYQKQADNIVGKMTVASLDKEMLEKENKSPQMKAMLLFSIQDIGKITNHKGMSVDLFADLGRSTDLGKRLIYQSALAPENNDTSAGREQWDKTLKNQPIKESIARMDCGTHATSFVVKAFGKAYLLSLRNPYYKPATSDKKADLKMKPDIVQSGVTEIRRLLSSKTAIIVRAVHSDGFSFPVIRDSSFTHFLIIVGYGSNNKFLCLDPWPGGSRLTYTSGLFGDVKSAFMGILEYFPSSGQIRTPSEHTPHQSHDYIVIQGP